MKHHACQQFGARTPTRSLGIQSSLVARSPMLRSTPSGPLHRPAATSAASTGASALQPVLPACYSRKAEERSAHQMRSVDALETPQIDERAARPREASRQTAATLMSAGAAAAAAADQKMKVSEMQLQCTRGEVSRWCGSATYTLLYSRAGSLPSARVSANLLPKRRARAPLPPLAAAPRRDAIGAEQKRAMPMAQTVHRGRSRALCSRKSLKSWPQGQM